MQVKYSKRRAIRLLKKTGLPFMVRVKLGKVLGKFGGISAVEFEEIVFKQFPDFQATKTIGCECCGDTFLRYSFKGKEYSFYSAGCRFYLSDFGGGFQFFGSSPIDLGPFLEH